MLTIKRRYITAQVLLEAVDEEGNFVQEWEIPVRLLRKDETKLSFAADSLAAKMVAELNEKGRPARMGTTATMEVACGEGLQAGAGDGEAKPPRKIKRASQPERGAGDPGGQAGGGGDEGQAGGTQGR
jgi:hypothetical protein